MTIEARLAELALTLPAPPQPVGAYVGAVVAGNLVFVAGHGPRRPDGGHMAGKVPTEVGIEEAVEAARLCGLNILSSLRAAIGDLDRVERFVAIDNKCAWPNLTLMPDDSIVATIFGSPCHGFCDGAAECWRSEMVSGDHIWSSPRMR